MKLPGISSRSIIITLAVIVVVIPLSVYFVIEIRSTSKRISYKSDMSELHAIIQTELQKYYKKNGSYPENLQLIRETVLNRHFVSKIPEKHKDGHLLNEFKYSTDGSSYIMILEVVGYTHIYKAQKGEPARRELFINGRLVERSD